MKWPEMFVKRKTEEFLQDELPSLRQRIEYLEAEVKRLEAEKAGRKGRKPSAASS